MLKLWEVNMLIIVITLWCVPWYVYNQFIRRPDSNIMGTVVLELPRSFKCAIPYVSPNPEKNKCDNTNFDLWSIGHILVYMTLGMVLPGQYLLVFAISILCEMYEYAAGWRARWLLDPITNLLGYVVGSMIAMHLSSFSPHVQRLLSNPAITVMTMVCMGILLYLNKPKASQT